MLRDAFKEELSRQALPALRCKPDFLMLRDAIKEEIEPGHSRLVLSHHTDSDCREGENLGPAVTSLMECGLEDTLAAHDGNVIIRLDLPNMFENGDGFRLIVESEPQKKNEAQEQVCLDVLTLLLATSPQSVRLAPGPLVRGMDSVARMRVAAARFNRMVRSQALPATDSDRASLTDLLIEVVGDALHTETPPGLLHSIQTMKACEVEYFRYHFVL